jgi:AcrR family transcriptional regulator
MEEELVVKSAEMFLQYGFKTVTMDDIAQEMGISKKTIYKHFPNKESLVEASTLEVQKQLDILIRHTMDLGLNAIEENFAIKKIFKNMFKRAKTSPMYQLKKYYPKTWTKLMENEFCTFENCVVDNLERGVSDGLYRKELDARMIMQFYFTLVFGTYEKGTREMSMEEMLHTEMCILEYHTRAIATPKGVQILEEQLLQYQS